MTFIVSLAHFCEIHGPMMVMCTQTVENQDDLPKFYSPQLPESQFCQSCMLIIPQKQTNNSPSIGTGTLSTTTTNSQSTKVTNDNNESTGDGSKTTLTLEDQISNLLSSSTQLPNELRRPMTMKTRSEKNPNKYFVSTQFPTSTEIYSTLRQVIVRVFTAETTADLSKPIMFGDSKQGYSIALSFSLADKTARGAERRYSIIVTSNWEAEIINNYTFISTNLNKVVSSITNKVKNAQRQLDSEDMQSHDQYLRRSALKAKNLVDIVNDDLFFSKIHVWASFLLDSLHEMGTC